MTLRVLVADDQAPFRREARSVLRASGIDATRRIAAAQPGTVTVLLLTCAIYASRSAR